MGTRGLLGTVGITLALVAFAGPVYADTTDTYVNGWATVRGSPLEVGVGDGGSLHANLDGSGGTDVFWFDEAGLTLAVFEEGTVHSYGTVASEEANKFHNVSMPVAGGSGSAADPWTISSVWDAGSPARLRVTQVVRFAEGSPAFDVSYSVQNVSGGPLQFRSYISAEALDGFNVPLARLGATGPGSAGLVVPIDGGTRDPNDPTFDGLDFGRAVELENEGPVPFTRSVAGEGNGATLAISQGDALPSSLPTRGRWQPLVAAEWDRHAPGKQALPAGATFEFGARFRHASALQTLPLITGADPAQPYTLQVRTDLADGGPLANRRLAWIVDGLEREITGTMTTDSAGHASLTWTSDFDTLDRVIVWIDDNGNGAWDRDTETTRQSWVDWYDDTSDAPGSGTNGSDVIATGGGPTSVTGTTMTPPSGAGVQTGTPAPTAVSLRTMLTISGLSLRRVKAGVVLATGRVSLPNGRRISLELRSRSKRLLTRGTATVRNGRFRKTLRLRRKPPSSRVLLTVRYPGDRGFAPLTRQRRLVIRR
jgi:hypothetical protein